MSSIRYVIRTVCLSALVLASCNGNPANHKTRKKTGTGSSQGPQHTKEKKHAPDIHTAVAVFRQNVDDAVTNNDFIVKVYPAKETDHFRLEVQYGGNKASDDVSMLPEKYYKKIELRKGKSDQECILGFIDNKGKFNEIKLITVSGTSIGIKTLKAYYLTTD